LASVLLIKRHMMLEAPYRHGASKAKTRARQGNILLSLNIDFPALSIELEKYEQASRLISELQRM
jgi:hypothetical protein